MTTVLIAEDEVLVRMMAADALVEAGFVIKEAEHASAALAILNSSAPQIRLLFTDINMPGAMDGLALAHHVWVAWPHIALLIVSGHTQPALTQLPAGSRFLAKPYDLDNVVSHARTLTASRQDQAL